MEKYEISPIKNFMDALEVRKIRNECRHFMTNDTSEINLLQQLIWYFKVYKKENIKGNLKCYLFKDDSNNLGFGLVRKSLGKYWITGGLMFNQRGKGLGTILFKELIQKVPSNEIWLEVLDTNIAANKIYHTLGFKKLNEKDSNGNRIIVMKLNK